MTFLPFGPDEGVLAPWEGGWEAGRGEASGSQGALFSRATAGRLHHARKGRGTGRLRGRSYCPVGHGRTDSGCDQAEPVFLEETFPVCLGELGLQCRGCHGNMVPHPLSFPRSVTWDPHTFWKPLLIVPMLGPVWGSVCVWGDSRPFLVGQGLRVCLVPLAKCLPGHHLCGLGGHPFSQQEWGEGPGAWQKSSS